MLDDAGGFAIALLESGLGAAAHSAARIAGVFVFLAVRNSCPGPTRDGVRNRHVGRGILGPLSRAGLQLSRLCGALAEICAADGTDVVRSYGDVARWRSGDDGRRHEPGPDVAAGESFDPGGSGKSVVTAWARFDEVLEWPNRFDPLP